MKKIIKALMLLCVTGFSLTCFAADNVYTESKTQIIVNAKQPTFILKLKSNPTTGYSWSLQSYKSLLISPVKHVFQAPDTKLIGASGYELWTFKVKPAALAVPHRFKVKMLYSRPWEHRPGKPLVFTVTTQN